MDPYDARVANLIGPLEVADHDIIDIVVDEDDWAEDTIVEERGQYWEPDLYHDPYCDEAQAGIDCHCAICTGYSSGETWFRQVT
jgi:hypothetical protein